MVPVVYPFNIVCFRTKLPRVTKVTVQDHYDKVSEIHGVEGALKGRYYACNYCNGYHYIVDNKAL